MEILILYTTAAKAGFVLDKARFLFLRLLEKYARIPSKTTRLLEMNHLRLTKGVAMLYICTIKKTTTFRFWSETQTMKTFTKI